MMIFFQKKVFIRSLESVSVLSKKYRSTSTGVLQYLPESTPVLLGEY